MVGSLDDAMAPGFVPGASNVMLDAVIGPPCIWYVEDGVDPDGVGIGMGRANDPVGIGRGGVIPGSIAPAEYIDDSGRPARQRARPSWNSAAD